jgi:DNA-binding SARP family transcriptional activator
VRFHLLGPLRVLRDGRPVSLGPAKQRGLLTALLLEPNRVVSVDRLVASLWEDDPPASAVPNVRTYASRLRAVLVDESCVPRLEGRHPGYLLRVAEGELDLGEFERLAAEGRDALALGDADCALRKLGAALCLWRGAAAEDVARRGRLDRRLACLDEERLALVEDWVGARLATGMDPRLVADLRVLTADHPFRERLWCGLVLALYRSGDVLGALTAFRQARRTFLDGLGVEPGPDLAGLHREVLARDPALDHHAVGTLTPVGRSQARIHR